MGKRKPQEVTAKEMKTIVQSSGKKAIYRQTCNWHNPRRPIWYVPKRLHPGSKWKTIVNKRDVILDHPRKTELALWRLWGEVDKLKNEDGSPKWVCKTYKVRVSIYTRYYLVCRWNANACSIHGIF